MPIGSKPALLEKTATFICQMNSAKFLLGHRERKRSVYIQLNINIYNVFVSTIYSNVILGVDFLKLLLVLWPSLRRFYYKTLSLVTSSSLYPLMIVK